MAEILEDVFMKPEVVPPNCPPISTQAAQAAGTAMSIAPAARERHTTDAQAPWAKAADAYPNAASVKPPKPTSLRPHLRLPVRTTSQSDNTPPERHATAPTASGIPA